MQEMVFKLAQTGLILTLAILVLDFILYTNKATPKKFSELGGFILVSTEALWLIYVLLFIWT